VFPVLSILPASLLTAYFYDDLDLGWYAIVAGVLTTALSFYLSIIWGKSASTWSPSELLQHISQVFLSVWAVAFCGGLLILICFLMSEFLPS